MLGTCCCSLRLFRFSASVPDPGELPPPLVICLPSAARFLRSFGICDQAIDLNPITGSQRSIH